ncbi:MAG: hypothetical protein HUK08_03760, partial [Bacteroidaceae bacterium]|nr:hypothetical protein [Bacteroidaceae bacterium]
KTAVIDEVNFYWDEVHLGYRAKAPFEIIIPTTEETKIGKHKICVACRVIAEGKSLAEAFTEFIVMVDEPEVKTNE